jgi:hypothetical protein
MTIVSRTSRLSVLVAFLTDNLKMDVVFSSETSIKKFCVTSRKIKIKISGANG